ncbi:MAG: DUF4058 family protein [Chloroflexales bacterium]|nr:DUF4058 family protein [Chloroflexales bacterium]
MPSPFPGMDPYLEGHLWPDVHNALAYKIRQQLAPQIQPRYTARLETYVVQDSEPEAEIGILYPDVEVLLARADDTYHGTPAEPMPAGAPAPISIPVIAPVDVRIPTVEIRDAANNQLITCIEILSPVNKRAPGLSAYRQRRQRLASAGVHLLELDLLRRGTRVVRHPRLPTSAYLALLTRAQARVALAWPIGLRDVLPILPTPLRAPDPDVVLDLGAALAAIYDEARYDLSIDYRQDPPPPPLTADDAAWLRTLRL